MHTKWFFLKAGKKTLHIVDIFGIFLIENATNILLCEVMV
jgi:hypothetical protein